MEVEQLGGEDILKALHAAHKEYGEAIGITASPEDATKIREALDGFTDALRAYVVRVSASVSKKDKKSPASAATVYPVKCGYRVVEMSIDYNERVGQSKLRKLSGTVWTMIRLARALPVGKRRGERFSVR